jgi:hypothetical protein
MARARGRREDTSTPRSGGGPKAVKAVEQPRRPPDRAVLGHLLWFLPFYGGLAGALYLGTAYLRSGFVDRGTGMAALAAAVLGILLMVPWARLLGRIEDRWAQPRPGAAPRSSRVRD